MWIFITVVLIIAVIIFRKTINEHAQAAAKALHDELEINQKQHQLEIAKRWEELKKEAKQAGIDLNDLGSENLKKSDDQCQTDKDCKM